MELSAGRLEMLPMPTQAHQLIVMFHYHQFFNFISSRQLGMLLVAPLRVKVSDGRIREPDIVFMAEENKDRRSNDYWLGADLVVEVISNDDPKRDLETKRREYAEADIPEYWIVDPRDSTICVLKLTVPGSPYEEAGVYRSGQQAASVLLGGLAVDVNAVFAAANA